MSGETVQHVFICGAKSIGQYGGYETFLDRLTACQQGNGRVRLHIACKANGEGCMEEQRLSGVIPLGPGEFEYHGAHCVKLRVPNIGPAVAVYYDWLAVRYFIRYCERNGIRRPIFYILTCRIGPVTAGLKRRIRALEGVLHVNPDGHEWMREKWPRPVRKYWKLSEKLMVKHADLLVCDSVNIQHYIGTEYKKYRPATVYIAYGAELTPSRLGDEDPGFLAWLKEKGLEKGSYFLVVGRFVPENNYETMIREFMSSHTQRAFAIITNSNQAFLERLEERLHFRADPRIRFVGTVYEPELLKKIRENAWAYFHGHEVGGTNPSLLEALGATEVNLLLDVGFNREVARDAALYWTKEPGSLAALIDGTEKMGEEERHRLGRMARERIRTAYSWPLISEKYDAIWRETERR